MKTPTSHDAVSVKGDGNLLLHGVLRIAYVRNDGIAVCDRINEDGTTKFVTLPDGRRMALRRVAHFPVASLYVRDDVPFVKSTECEFCGDAATKIEQFDREVFVCDECAA